MKTRPVLIFALLCTVAFTSCKKTPAGDAANPCEKIKETHAHPFTAVTKGAEIYITADSLADAWYEWTGPGNFQSSSQSNTVSTYADYTDEGWYYVRISHDGCTSHFDSVYVEVKFPQGTPTCTPANNSANFSGALILGDQAFSFISFGDVSNGYGVTANSSNGDMTVALSTYWSTHEFKDGIYYTTNNPLPDYSDIGAVYISDVNQSIYWVAEADKPVYISHVGGKRRITFCGIQFSGDLGGPVYHTTISAQITQP